MKKLLFVLAITATALLANPAGKVMKHEMKKEMKGHSKAYTKGNKKASHLKGDNANEKAYIKGNKEASHLKGNNKDIIDIDKAERKMKRKAIKAVL
ncbi:hypothetical protein [Sulfurovum riftiae]|uniref:Uncharacterized protein n=1 Tax=Sulfurovum riftiae TaxID=1630136 RepID=A0A151CHZ0_9BACT|nr:hypothetical protein [Sulfurovum riftiae]KYJ87054.1 hypothetical protein AS592_02395 [Sulfurovum riftiae]